jgi:hypothetical protein
MAKGKLEAGDEVELRATVERVWPNGQITIFIKSATAGGRLMLLDAATSLCRAMPEAVREAVAAGVIHNST